MARFMALGCVAVLVLSASPARADDFVTDIPVKNMTTNAPLVVDSTSVIAQNINQPNLACVSFRNTTTKTATFARFTFRFDDLLGNPIREAVLNRSGSFAPNIAIEGKMSTLGGNSDSFLNCAKVSRWQIHPSLETIELTEVRFQDGSVWKKGDANPNGTSSTPGTTGTAPGIGGAVGSGGVVGSGSGGFGAIAWVPGSRDFVATSLNQQNQEAADYDSLTKCNTAAGGGTKCQIAVRMSGSNKCGALAIDDNNKSRIIMGTAQGPDSGATIQTALKFLQDKGGTIAANSIIASGCNS